MRHYINSNFRKYISKLSNVTLEPKRRKKRKDFCVNEDPVPDKILIATANLIDIADIKQSVKNVCDTMESFLKYVFKNCKKSKKRFKTVDKNCKKLLNKL